MGIRVRKLARELRCTAGDVLGLLQQLGYERYRSPEDMVSDVVAAKIRSASATPVPAPHRAHSMPMSPPSAPSTESDDLMASLVPGVVRQPPREWEQPGSNAQVARAQAELAAERETLREQVARLEQERAELARAREALETERAELREAREQLRAQPEPEPEVASESEAASPSQPAGEVEGEVPKVVSVFESRGLRGADEVERALAALASARILGRHLHELLLADPEGWDQLLRERLVLVGGAEAPPGLELPSVVVSRDRADIPGGRELSRALTSLGEQLMLSGCVRATVLGMPPKWVPVVREGVDQRITLGFRGGWSSDAVDQGPVLLWGHGADLDALLPLLEEAEIPVFVSTADTLMAWLQEIRSALEDSG